jgi:hypothetical protein
MTGSPRPLTEAGKKLNGDKSPGAYSSSFGFLVSACHVYYDHFSMTGEPINYESGQGPKKHDETQTEAQLAHDKEVFQRVNAIADEKALKSICHFITVFRFYDKQQLNTLYKLNRFGELIENQFLNRALKVSYSLFHLALREMMNMVMMTYLTEGDRYVLYPDLRNAPEGSEERKLYDDAAAAVDKAVDNAMKSYRSFRQLVKSTLYI